jgi:hypothetical protein
MGCPEVSAKVAGVDRLVLVQVPEVATPLRRTTTGPEPMAFTSISLPPCAFSTQVPTAVGTVKANRAPDDVLRLPGSGDHVAVDQ